MIKVLANKTLAFDHPTEKHPKTNLPVRAIAKYGKFCELPDWVSKTNYFQMAINDGSLQAFKDSKDSEKVGTLYEEKQRLEKEIRRLQEEKELLETANNEQKEVLEETKPKRRGRKKATIEEQKNIKEANYLAIGDEMPVTGSATALGMNLGINPNDETANTEDLIEVG